ncbi:hypothetical protein [uncultured Nocardioides sp.]|uniref:hypothetical protein n=1 Tax=uncultured Nocardioides sp. TaxID=198441 RepID=UPI002609DD9B|nr:hypothetical protein [uncultured Nocardioides sp.]
MGRLPTVLVLVALWVSTTLLLTAVLMGPERYVRKVVRNLRPDAAGPTERGHALLFWRNLALLVLVASFAVLRTVEEVGPTTDELVEATELVTDLVPADELDGGRLEAELRLLLGDRVLVEDVSASLPAPVTEEDSAAATPTVDRTSLEVRRLTLGERASGYVDDDSPPSPAACVVVERTSYGSLGPEGYAPPEDAYSVAFSTGRCEPVE